MREIKFRAWHKAENKMKPVSALTWSEPYGGIVLKNEDGSLYNITTIEPANNKIGEYHESCITDELELMQYTGLKDKNGVEIYDGDFVKYKNKLSFFHLNQEVEVPCGLIGFYGGVFGVLINQDKPSDGLYPLYMCDIEVIGNIYENPELLTK